MKFKGHEAQINWRGAPDEVEEYKDASHAAGGGYREYALRTHSLAQEYVRLKGMLDEIAGFAQAVGMSQEECLTILLARLREAALTKGGEIRPAVEHLEIANGRKHAIDRRESG